MGTKKAKTKAKAMPAAAPVESAPLKPGQLWTHPETGRVSLVEQCEDVDTCSRCVYDNSEDPSITCPNISGVAICLATQTGTPHGVRFIDPPAPKTAPAADFDKVPKVKKAKGKKAPQPAPAQPETEAAHSGLTRRQLEIPASCLIEAPWNKREEIDAESVADLVASIKAVGLIQRVAVMRDRPDEAGERFIILAGHRRVKACQLAGLSPIPCEVVDCDDKTAHMITAVENMHRADLTSMQEAEVVADLLNIGYSAEEIAERTGWHLRRVYRRASLKTLTAEWRNAAHVHGLCAAFLEELSRLPAETQAAVKRSIDNRWDCKTMLTNSGDVGALRRIVSDLVMEVAKAPWSKAHPDWCANCERCSDARADLFEETEVGENALCLDRACWDRRKEQMVELQRRELEAKHGEVKTATDQDYRFGRLSDAKSRKDKNHSKPVLITDGDSAGKVLWVASAGDKKAAKERGEPVPDSRQPTIEQKRMAWVIKKVDAMLDDSKTARPCPFEQMGEFQVIRAVTAFGTHFSQRGADGTDWEELENGNIEGVLFNLWTQVAPVLKMRMSFMTIITCESAYDEAVACAAWAFNIKKADLDAEAAEAIKDKSKKGEKI